MFSNVVLGVKMENFDHILSTFKAEKKYTQDTDMTAEDWKAIVKLYQKVTHVPSDPHEQLQLAIRAVFSSWMTPRAIKYRQYNDIPDTLGTGVTVQVREGGREEKRERCRILNLYFYLYFLMYFLSHLSWFSSPPSPPPSLFPSPQSMVFGNMGQDSGTGVAFTRNPSTGENVHFGVRGPSLPPSLPPFLFLLSLSPSPSLRP
jgi:pyruvate,orthophosphate dikinase